MSAKHPVSRRRFVSGLAAAVGYLKVGPDLALAQGRGAGQGGGRAPRSAADYDALAKLANNENPYGPPDSAMQAMNGAWKYANRYGYPDPGLMQALADHHGVKTENLLLGAGSGEILDVVGSTFGPRGKKVVGVEPSYSQVYQHVTSVKGEAIKLPLGKDYRQDMDAIIKAAKDNAKDVGFVYLCNPNNPTGLIVTRQEVKHLLDNLPEGMPVLIDEAYHHFVEDPNYATSVPYVIEGRPVIIARTFSKIAGMAAMRIGYAVAPAALIQQMRPNLTGTVNVLARYGAMAALKDTAAQEKVKRITIDLRKKTTADLNALGYETIPSEANFFMVGIKREVQPVIQEFSRRGVLVGRPFPPMTQHLRVSIGTPDEMDRFMKAFKEIFPAVKATGSSGKAA